MRKKFDSRSLIPFYGFWQQCVFGKDAQGPLTRDAREPFRHLITQGPGLQERSPGLEVFPLRANRQPIRRQGDWNTTQ